MMQTAIDITEMNASASAEAIIEALKAVYDPELGVDIINLGLVYGLTIVGENVQLLMTLTTPGCPLHATIEQDVLRNLEKVPGVGWIDVQIVWDPPWTPERITEEAKKQLYWL